MGGESPRPRPAAVAEIEATPRGAGMSGYQFDVFISYARGGRTEDFALRLRSELETALNDHFGRRTQGSRVFLDQHSTQAGGDVDARICGGLRGSAVLLALLSDGYCGRPWCVREARTFRLREQEIGWSGDDPQAPALLYPLVAGPLDPTNLPADLCGVLRSQSWETSGRLRKSKPWSKLVHENYRLSQNTRDFYDAVAGLAAVLAHCVRQAPAPQGWPIAPLPDWKNPAGPRPIGAP
jgi:hypothetical protein